MARLWTLAAVIAPLALPISGLEPSSPEPSPGRVKGTVKVAMEGVRLADVGPVVAYIDRREASVDPEPPAEVPKISQRDATFSPDFLVITAGQTVEMPNDDVIYHNVFSFSKPNHFDLGVYPRGTAKSVRFVHPGVVRIYCSIHASMSAVIFVAPTPHHAVVSASGAFAIGGIPKGRYSLRLWTERLPEIAREIDIEPGKELEVDFVFESQTQREKR